jgi:MFS family permease
MLLNAAEAGLAQAFAYLFTTIYPRELAGKRIMATNLAQCISGAFGGLFAYAIQTMGARNGLEAWRWLFIIEFLITIVICGIGWAFLPKRTGECLVFERRRERDHASEEAARLYAQRKRQIRAQVDQDRSQGAIRLDAWYRFLHFFGCD